MFCLFVFIYILDIKKTKKCNNNRCDQTRFVLFIAACCACFSQDELLAELDELEQEELDKNLLEIGPENVPLPNVPSTLLPSRPGERASKRALQHRL